MRSPLVSRDRDVDWTAVCVWGLGRVEEDAVPHRRAAKRRIADDDEDEDFEGETAETANATAGAAGRDKPRGEEWDDIALLELDEDA